MVFPIIGCGAAVISAMAAVKYGLIGDVVFTGIFGFLSGAHVSMAFAILVKRLRGWN